MQNTLQQPREEKKLFLNPLFKKLTSIKGASENVSTYGGVFGKFVYFMLMIIVGIGAALVLNKIDAFGVVPVTGELYAEKYVVISLLASFVVFALFPLLAFIIRKTIPVIGALYCVGTGFLLGFMMVLDEQIRGYMMLALALTFSIVTVMGLMYFKGYIHVTNKFRAVTATLFTTMITSSLILVICSFIPALKEGVAVIQNNLLLSIAISVGGIIVATLFLLIDFDTIKKTVDNRLPKEYEWFAAFGFLFTIVWLYFKVLDLVFKIKDATH